MQIGTKVTVKHIVVVSCANICMYCTGFQH